jgi:hypothetical protein
MPAAPRWCFWGADRGPVTNRDNSGVTTAGGPELTITGQFARSMSPAEAMAHHPPRADPLTGRAGPHRNQPAASATRTASSRLRAPVLRRMVDM